MRAFTKEQKEKIHKELSLDNINSKYNKFMCKLQDKLDPLHFGKRVLPANLMYLEELVKLLKSLKPTGHGFVIQVPIDGSYCFTTISLYDDILNCNIDDLIIDHIKLQHFKYGEPTIYIDFNGIFKDINKQVKAFLKSL